MKKRMLALLSATALSTAYLLPSLACTDVKLTAKDGTIMIARSMEFAVDVQSSIRTSTRNHAFKNTAPNGKPGLAWNARFGFIYLDGFGQNIALDGMNEAGLSFEYLYLPGETEYQTVPNGHESQALSYAQFGNWILSNFKSIDEVKQALDSVYVVPEMLPGLGTTVLPAHASITDSTGKGIIVEFINGEKKIYDSIGIMTNSPQYNWHVTNLRNYLNLSPFSPKPVVAGGMTFTSTGQGTGSIGLPGDYSPPSRFVKASFLATTVFQGNNATDTTNIAQHIMNNFDIPAGASRSTENGKVVSDTTEWVVIKDLTHKTLSYRSYNDLTLKTISLDKLDFSEKGPLLKMPITGNQVIPDITTQFMSSK